MTAEKELRRRLIDAVAKIQSLPFVWPCQPDAPTARRLGAGSCASKHALLAEELSSIGIESTPLLVVGPLVPGILSADAEFAAGRDLLEVHECLTALTTWAGPLRADVTWDPALIERGLPGTRPWDGLSDMALAIGDSGPGWSVPRSRLREAKEALRARLYAGGEREVRHETLSRIVARFSSWRGGFELAAPE